MQLKTILNHVERYKSFVYQPARWANAETKTAIEIPIQPRVGGRPVCSGCGQTAPGYDLGLVTSGSDSRVSSRYLLVVEIVNLSGVYAASSAAWIRSEDLYGH